MLVRCTLHKDLLEEIEQARSIHMNTMNTAEYAPTKDMINTQAGITLAEYKRAAAELRIEEGRIGFFAHAIAYTLINAFLIVFNVVFAPEYLWFFFPLIFWGFGLLMHYLYEVRFVRNSIEEREARIEYRARQSQLREASAA